MPVEPICSRHLVHARRGWAIGSRGISVHESRKVRHQAKPRSQFREFDLHQAAESLVGDGVDVDVLTIEFVVLIGREWTGRVAGNEWFLIVRGWLPKSRAPRPGG